MPHHASAITPFAAADFRRLLADSHIAYADAIYNRYAVRARCRRYAIAAIAAAAFAIIFFRHYAAVTPPFSPFSPFS
jgi:hypothetical protein